MAGEWREVAVSDLADLSGGFAFKSGDYSPSGRFILRTLNISDDCSISRDDAVYIPEELCSQYARFQLQPNDTLFVMVGATLGKVGYVREKDLPALLNQNMWLIRAKRGIADARFIHYAFRHAVKASLGWASGSARDFVRRDDYRNLLIPTPPLPEQRTIAHILGTLDDKIELNRRMNETLEAMARALFKSWFVDFDPVRAKAEGSDPGLPKHIAELFPDSFEDSELGEIPKGWRCSYLGKVTTKIGSGATPRGGGSVYVDDGVALVRSQNVYDSLFVWEGLARITDAAADALYGVTVEREDILMNITGASILRTCVVDPDVLPARVNQHVCIIRPKHEIPARYIHFHLLQPSTKGFLMGMDAGASRQAVTKGHIESVPLVIPPKAVLDFFASLVGPLFGATSNNESQSRSLASIRDALLPKLISGDLRVQDAERFIGRAL